MYFYHAYVGLHVFLYNAAELTYVSKSVVSKVKQSHHTPWRRLGGKELQFLLILDLGTRWG
jgi:hypothetical protein